MQLRVIKVRKQGRSKPNLASLMSALDPSRVCNKAVRINFSLKGVYSNHLLRRMRSSICNMVRLYLSVQDPIRILLVDEQTILREGLRLIIENYPEFQVIGDAGDKKKAIDMASLQQPRIIVVDPALECDQGGGIIGDLLTAAKDAYVIILTAAKLPEAHKRAVLLGARGLVFKQEASQILIKAIKKVHAGEIWLERYMTATLLTEALCGTRKVQDPEAKKIANLTLREHEVINLISEGLKNKEIAARLFISESTVSHHLTSIFNKLGTSDRLQLIVYAHRHGLTKQAQ